MDAARKFWTTPELGERLVSLLDPLSTLRLIQSDVMDKETLQKSLSFAAWSNLISGTSNSEQRLLNIECVRILVKVLWFMELEEPGPFLLPLLDQICAFQVICESDMCCESCDVVIICPCHKEPHAISMCAFRLLEEVESAFGTTEQIMKSVSCFGWPPMNLLLAVSSRMSRQKETVTCIHIPYGNFCIKDKSSVDAFVTLLRAEAVCFETLEVGGIVGKSDCASETVFLGNIFPSFPEYFSDF